MNGPGGKIDPGETAIECAVRETREELHITATDVVEAGRLWFDFVDGTKIHCIVFRADDFDDDPTETDEAAPMVPGRRDPVRPMAGRRTLVPVPPGSPPVRPRATFDDDRLLDAELG
ncbi:MAG: NUDIX domain-containing protein [Ilumatobacteraceae bacterium]